MTGKVYQLKPLNLWVRRKIEEFSENSLRVCVVLRYRMLWQKKAALKCDLQLLAVLTTSIFGHYEESAQSRPDPVDYL